MKLIVGLGNPGKEYNDTRHNAGFLALDEFAMKSDANWSEDPKHQSITAKAVIEEKPCILLKPQTFMNLSGQAIQSLASYYKVAPENILIVHDEMDLAPGTLAFKADGGDAGHNGIASIIEHLGRNAFARLRIGIGRPTVGAKEDWVLGKMDDETAKKAEQAADAIKDWVTMGLEKAMNKWNTR